MLFGSQFKRVCTVTVSWQPPRGEGGGRAHDVGHLACGWTLLGLNGMARKNRDAFSVATGGGGECYGCSPGIPRAEAVAEATKTRARHGRTVHT